MSCSICLLPFYPSPNAPRPAFPSDGIVSISQKRFLTTAVAMGYEIPHAVLGLEYLGKINDQHTFRPLPPHPQVNILWDEMGETRFIAHATCSHAFLTVMGIPLVYQKMRADHIRSIVGFELIMNKCEGGPYDGMSRIPNVDYAEVGGVDPEDYWKMPMLQEGRFEWRTVKASKDAWILARPNIFPRFYPEVSDGRLASVAEPDETSDVLTTLPIDIIHALVSVLDMKTFIFLVSTCRTMRRYAFTSLQPYARKHVLDLPWTTPFLDSDPPEFIDSQKQAHRVDSPHDGDWLLYLSHVHRTDSMRERRRIWAICEEAKKQYVKYRQIVRQQERWPKLEAKIDKKTMNVLAAMLALRADRSRR